MNAILICYRSSQICLPYRIYEGLTFYLCIVIFSAVWWQHVNIMQAYTDLRFSHDDYYNFGLVFWCRIVLQVSANVSEEKCCLHLQGWSDKAGKYMDYLGSEKQRLRKGNKTERRRSGKSIYYLIPEDGDSMFLRNVNIVQPSAYHFKCGASLRCKGSTACSSVHVLLWVRECSQGLFALLVLCSV
jgi:hypothetical protein